VRNKVVANPDEAGPGWTVDQIFYTELLVPANDSEPVMNNNGYTETRSKTVHHVVRTPQFLMKQEPDQTVREAAEQAACALDATNLVRQELATLAAKHHELQDYLVNKDIQAKALERTITALNASQKTLEGMLAGVQKQRDLAQEDLKMVVGYVGTQVYEKLIHAREAEGAVAMMGAPQAPGTGGRVGP
jgi:hypothetical protein